MSKTIWILCEYDHKKVFTEVNVNDTFEKYKRILEIKFETKFEKNVKFVKIGEKDEYEDMNQTFKDAGITEMTSFTIVNSTSEHYSSSITSKPTHTATINTKPAQPAPAKPAKPAPAQPAQPAPSQPTDSELSRKIQEVSQVTNVTDLELIKNVLLSNNQSVAAAINIILDQNQPNQNVVTETSSYSDAIQQNYNKFTQAEKEAIERLKSNGFSLSQCVEMFIACDKNEEATLSLLLSG